MNRCPTCGTKYSDDVRFCTRDGTKVSNIATVAGAAPKHARRGDAHVGRTLDARFAIERKIGEGGMSCVYLATDGTGGRFAIKVLAAPLARDATAMARLRREAGFGMRLEHPNVCPIVHFGQTRDGLMFIAMPFVDGELLSGRMRRLGHIPLIEAAALVRDIAAGLGAAHALAIVHRDLKPENVIVRTFDDGTLQAVVMDFGLAKERIAGMDRQTLTATGMVIGTPEFMSPEQVRGRPVDSRSDIYALALVTYEMLTGALPFSGQTQQELMLARLRSDPVPLRRMRPEFDLPESAERVLAKALSRNPDDRYATTSEFADAFESAAETPAYVAGWSDRRLEKLFGH